MWARALVAWESEEEIDGRVLPCASWTGMIFSGAKISSMQERSGTALALAAGSLDGSAIHCHVSLGALPASIYLSIYPSTYSSTYPVSQSPRIKPYPDEIEPFQ